MTTKTYLEIQAQIESLQHEAEAVRRQEVAGVISRIREAIRVYGLTASDLGLGDPSRKATQAVPAKTGKVKTFARYRDDSGNEWSGRGPRPQWLRAALAAGRQIEDFVVSPTGAPSAATKKSRQTASKTRTAATATKAQARHAPGTVRYRDPDGNSWTGMGPKPRWLKASIASGKKLEDFAV